MVSTFLVLGTVAISNVIGVRLKSLTVDHLRLALHNLVLLFCRDSVLDITTGSGGGVNGGASGGEGDGSEGGGGGGGGGDCSRRGVVIGDGLTKLLLSPSRRRSAAPRRNYPGKQLQKTNKPGQ